MLRQGAQSVLEMGITPELEIFDTGNLWFALQMAKEGLLPDNALFQFCHGIPWGAPPEMSLLKAMVDMLPSGTQWTSFVLGRQQIPWAAQAMLLGGHVRVGLEDNLYLRKGEFATNGQLVEKAVNLAELLGTRVLTPSEAREKLRLRGIQ